MKYYKTNQLQVNLADTDASSQIETWYERGYLLGRNQPGAMWQTRSLRLNSVKFELTSENRRILKKFPDYIVKQINLPMGTNDYHWRLHKLGKAFYQKKFTDIDFSANKIKQVLTSQFGFNMLLTYGTNRGPDLNNDVGFCICYQTSSLWHYAYPFYDLTGDTNNLGMFMMIKAILLAQQQQIQYIYLGGVTRPTDKYKLQFKGLEWFDGEKWQAEIGQLKQMVTAFH